MEGPALWRRDFVQVGRFQAVQRDADATSHDEAIRSLPAQISASAASATQNAANAAAIARKAAADADRYAAEARTSANDADRYAAEARTSVDSTQASADRAEADAWRAVSDLQRQELDEWRKASGIPDKRPGEPLTPEEQKQLISSWVAPACDGADGALVCVAGKPGVSESIVVQIAKACRDNPRCATTEQLDWLLNETFDRYLSGLANGFNNALDVADALASIADGGRLSQPFRVGINGEATLDPPDQSSSGGRADWLKSRLQDGIQFNQDNRGRYPINELHVGAPFPLRVIQAAA
nr:hypothetical protein [Amycolatopsis sulphurea]